MTDTPTKAIAGAVVAGSSTLVAVAADGAVSWVDVAAIAGAVAAGYLGVWWAPRNKPRAGRRRRRA